MSVAVIVRVQADPSKLEAYAQENGEKLKAIAERGKAAGAIHHAFFAGDGEVVVIDEWPSGEAFQSFFASDEEIPQVMEGVGAAGEPAVEVLNRLETGDDF